VILQNYKGAFVGLAYKYSLLCLYGKVSGPYPELEKSGFGKEVGEVRKNKLKDER